MISIVSRFCSHLSCSYEIEGHPTLATILNVNTMDMEEDDHLHLFFIGIVNDIQEKVYILESVDGHRKKTRYSALPRRRCSSSLLPQELDSSSSCQPTAPSRAGSSWNTQGVNEDFT